MDDSVTFLVARRGRYCGTFLKSGEITIHTHTDGTESGAIVLRCPVCNGLQHVVAKIQGPDDAPTIPTPIKCGCKKCNKSFRIRSGRPSVLEDEKETPKVEISDGLKDMGVFYPSSERGWK